jgi:hypothetical protein
VSLAFSGCSSPEGPCFGLQLDHPYAVTVEDHYDEMSKFTFTKMIASDPTPSCDPQLLIADGTKLTMKVIKQMSDNGCAQSYATVEDLPNVTFRGDFRYDYPYGLGAILVWNTSQQPEGGDLFRSSRAGQLPEVVMQEVYMPASSAGCSLSPTCSDYYVVTVSP